MFLSPQKSHPKIHLHRSARLKLHCGLWRQTARVCSAGQVAESDRHMTSRDGTATDSTRGILASENAEAAGGWYLREAWESFPELHAVQEGMKADVGALVRISYRLTTAAAGPAQSLIHTSGSLSDGLAPVHLDQNTRVHAGNSHKLLDRPLPFWQGLPLPQAIMRP
jgi:hypothetical protein